MKKVFILLLLVMFQSVSFAPITSASEHEKTLGNPILRNTLKVIKPTDVSTDLKGMKRIAILISSTSPLLGQAAEDLCMMKLRDRGLSVVDRAKLTKATLTEYKSMEKNTGAQGDKNAERYFDEVRVGKQLGLNGIFYGTLFEGRRMNSIPDANPPVSIEKTVVSTFHLQLMDIQSEQIVLSILLEYDMGENLSNSVDTMIKAVKEEIKL